MKMISVVGSFACIVLAAIFVPATDASPYVIADSRVRNLDITPVLGRGYSIMTNSYQSTCLQVEETTIPSYNYDYTFSDFTQSTDLEKDMNNKIGYSFAYWWLKEDVKSEYSQQTKVETKTRYIVSTMRIERYYASVREEVSPLAAPAQELLNRQDYVGFFKACGPNYVRGIRRAQEVTAKFQFQSTSTETASQYASEIQVSSSWWRNSNYRSNFNSKTKYAAESQSLRITILGYGMGLTQTATIKNDMGDMDASGATEGVESGGPTALNELGAETLVATSLEDYNNVMKFAFNTMTKNKDSVHIGMVYGMEVVPWVENLAFQVESGLQDEAIEVPLPRSVIPRAYRRSNPSDKTFINAERDAFRCKELAYSIDRYGYCCESDALYDYAEQEYDPEDPEVRICRPLRVLDKAIVTENMATNGEFVARLDRAVTYKVNQLSTMEKCISAVRAIPERFDYNILKPQDTVKYDGAVDFNFTVFELKMALDPFEDYSLLRHMAKELDEFMDMYYQPCVASLFGTNIGRTSDTDPSYFMAYPWHTHDECTHISCLANSMRWDRKNGGCVPSLISGYNAAKYEAAEEKLCGKDPESGEVETCKYDSSELAEYHEKVTRGWRETVPLGRVDYFMGHFCMPQITDEKISDENECILRAKHSTEVAESEIFNVALNKPSRQSSTYPVHYGRHGKAKNANDGITNGRYRNGSVAHTKEEENPWWEVDLRGLFSIKWIVVYNRTDGSSERLRDFKVYIYKNGGIAWEHQYQGQPEHKTELELDAIAGAPIAGNLVKIELPRKDILNFAELEVWATPSSDAISSCSQRKCVLLEFITSTAQHSTSGGTFNIKGYGQISRKCHDRPGASCYIQLCNTDYLEMTTTHTDAWSFTIKGPIGDLVDYKTVSGGAHVPPFPTWMDSDQHDTFQKYKLIR